jgi:hypothetical protein
LLFRRKPSGDFFEGGIEFILELDYGPVVWNGGILDNRNLMSRNLTVNAPTLFLGQPEFLPENPSSRIAR